MQNLVLHWFEKGISIPIILEEQLFVETFEPF